MGMTREEFSAIAKGMKAVYASEKFMPDKDSFDVWYMLLNEYEYEAVSVATRSYMSTERFAPAPADIINMIHKLKNPIVTELEAWAKVRKAINNSGYNSVEEFGKLPEIIQKIIGSPNQLYQWSQTSIDEIETVIQSNFMRSYKAKVIDQKEIERMPQDVRAMVAEKERLLING